MEHWERDKRIWALLQPLLNGWLRRKLGFSPQIARVSGPCLVLSNHTTDWDPLLLALSFPKHQLYFVASEHIFRWGLLWRVVNWLVHPIARMKGTLASSTVMTVMRNMKKGASVCIFAEGDRSWDGRTGGILPSTGKLARSCGGSLVTYRLEGGYLTSPRWSGSGLRRGKMLGHVVNVYTREQLRAMTPDMINTAIKEDLYEDAFSRQRREPVAYRGKALAEGLETMLHTCPVCGASGTLQSAGDTLSCSACGLAVTCDEYGFLHGDGLPFDNCGDWDRWQNDRQRELIAGGDIPRYSDAGVTLRRLLPEHGQQTLGSGGIALEGDALLCCGLRFPAADISGIAMHGRSAINLSLGTDYYEITADRPLCLRKYMTAAALLMERAQPRKDA